MPLTFCGKSATLRDKMSGFARKWMERVETQSMLRWGIHAGLIVAVALASWHLSVTLRAKPLTSLSSDTAPYTVAPRPVDIRSAARLFGAATPKLSIAPLLTAAATDVKLVGVVAADDPDDSLAIIEVNGEAKTYSIGASLPDGETLKAVTSQGVTLANRQAEQDLALAQQQAPTDAVFATLPVQVQAAGNDGTSPHPILPIKPAPRISMAQQMTALRQAALQVLMERSRHAPPASGQASPN